MNIKYTITFLDYWHLSSGLSAGARLDSTVVKDSDGLPFVPGKTIKGLLREQMELIDGSSVIKYFGEKGTEMGQCYFTNATLPTNEKDEIVANKLQSHLYDTISSTKIDENGVAKDNTLREIEVVVPISIYGEIKNADEKESFQKAMGMIKRMGLNRHRGLGRCEIAIRESK